MSCAEKIMVDETIPDRLFQIMLKHGIPEQKVRTKMGQIGGVTKQAVSSWYSEASSDPKAKIIAAIADYCGADLMWVITGVEATKKITGYVTVEIPAIEIPAQTIKIRINVDTGEDS